jgi:hypothetical protein
MINGLKTYKSFDAERLIYNVVFLEEETDRACGARVAIHHLKGLSATDVELIAYGILVGLGGFERHAIYRSTGSTVIFVNGGDF